MRGLSGFLPVYLTLCLTMAPLRAVQPQPQKAQKGKKGSTSRAVQGGAKRPASKPVVHPVAATPQGPKPSLHPVSAHPASGARAQAAVLRKVSATRSQTPPLRLAMAVRSPAPAAVAPSRPVHEQALELVTRMTENARGTLENGAALVPFFEQISHPPASGALHILQYGDSHTASDDWVNAMRLGLQRRFGNGGPGFTLAGHPYRGYRRFDVVGNGSAGWYSDGLPGRAGDGRYGLAGISVTSHAAGETVSMLVDCSDLSILYLSQPGGGDLEYLIDGLPSGTISTSDELGPGTAHLNTQPGLHQYTLRTLSSAPVRLFGWVAENDAGITYETLGINGAQAASLLDWDESILDQQIAQRQPALIVMAYGTNEAYSPKWTAEDYRASLTQAVKRLRKAAPTASILLVGPPDCERRLAHGRYPAPHLAEVIEVQRQIAYEQGCAFWDWRASMGGPGSVAEWVLAGLGQGDYTHLTTAGYHLVGDLLIDEILQQYSRFLAVRTE